MDEHYNMVKDFHRAFSAPCSDKPVFIEKDYAKLRYKWMLEELDEFLEADNIEDQADAMIDLMYFALGTMVSMGVLPDKLFRIVHSANMSKLWEDGKPHYHTDGKTKKPPGWADPYPLIKEEINRQLQHKEE